MFKKYLIGICLIIQISANPNYVREAKRWLQRFNISDISFFSALESEKFIEYMNNDAMFRTVKLENANIVKNVFLSCGWNKTIALVQSSAQAKKAWYSILWVKRSTRYKNIKV